MKRFFCWSSLAFLMVMSSAPRALAKQFTLWGEPLNLGAYAAQTLQVGLTGDHYDTERGLQQALTTLFAEADYRPRHDLTLYVSGLFAVDWIYEIKDEDETWTEKNFWKSRDSLFVDDKDWQLLKEAHFTWTPGRFYFRVGKQIVSWGEMDFFRIMDQINPLDQRRGFSDVEFESTIIPIWLLRTEWWPQLDVGWMEQLGFQLIFNPNAEWIPDQALTTGNERGGIWSAAYLYDNPAFDPNFPILSIGTPKMYVGPLTENLDRPESWSTKGFEYGVRMSLMIGGNVLTLNGFYGRENAPVELMTGFVENPVLSELLGQSVPGFGTAPDGTSIIYPIYDGFFPRQKYVGATWTSDLPFLRISALGGVTPLLRLEVKYQLDKTFKDELEVMYWESDFLDTGIGLDWKAKIYSLNPRAYFTIMPQFFFNRILDYPDDFKLWDLPDQDYYTVSCVLSTSYINGKLIPQVAWAFDINREAHLVLPSLSYSYSREWNFKLEGALFMGEEENTGFWLFRNKDYIAAKIKYSWG
ncbi:MAG: DUF1302 family protein [bacterium]